MTHSPVTTDNGEAATTTIDNDNQGRRNMQPEMTPEDRESLAAAQLAGCVREAITLAVNGLPGTPKTIQQARYAAEQATREWKSRNPAYDRPEVFLGVDYSPERGDEIQIRFAPAVIEMLTCSHRRRANDRA
jgi:hypothetical protein